MITSHLSCLPEAVRSKTKKVPAPNVIGMLRSGALSRVVAVTEATFLSFFHGYFKSFLLPNAIHSLRVDRPAKLTKLATNQAIAVAREFSDELQHFDVKLLVSYDLFQLAVLIFKLLEAFRFAGFHAAVLIASTLVLGFADRQGL